MFAACVFTKNYNLMNRNIQKISATCLWVLSFVFFASSTMLAQTVQVSGRCITGTINLTVDAGSPLNGKVWYSGTGTVLGFPGVVVNIYWDNGVNKWYLDFDGQAYFENADNTTLPPSTNVGTWVPTVDNTDCLTGPALSITGTGTGDREINVKQGVTNIADGGSFNYGNVNIGSNDNKVFTIENTGTLPLTLTAAPPDYISKNGANVSDFAITQPATGTINAAGSTTFSVLFTPGGPGMRSCTLYIANNDANENPYEIILSGTGVCPAITFTGTPTATCAGTTNGQIVVSGVTGGTGPYMYSKDNGANYQSGATFTGLAANTYQVVVKDANGCTSGATAVTVNSLPAPTCSVTGADYVCNNSPGNIYTAPAGMSAYNWSISGDGTINGSTTGPSVSVTAGNYINSYTVYVTVTDANGCTSTCSKESNIYLFTPPADITVNPNPACFGVTIDLSISAAASSTVAWTGEGITDPDGNFIPDGGGGYYNQTTAIPTSPGSKTYSVSVTADNGCSNTGSVNVTVNLLPAAPTCPSNSSVCLSTPAYALTGGSPGGGTYSGPGVSAGMFNPATAGAGTHTITYTVSDGNGCTNACTFEITVLASCLIDFSGKIIFSNNNSFGVNNALVSLTGSANGSDVSDVNGDFSISSGVGSGSFTLTPTKTVNKLNGVTAGDVSAIQQHVANTFPITDLYKQVAADVNKSNSITTIDASVINQALLGNPAALAQIKTSWRFVPTSHTMNNPPWGFPENRTYTNINANQTNQDFYGIKTGDVVTTFANPANFGTGQTLVLQDKDQVLQAGETFTVDFSAGQTDDLAAFQCALRFDPAQLQFVEIQPFAALPLTADNFGTYNIVEGEIRLVWAQATAVAVAEAAPVFRLQFTALQSGAKLSEVLQLDESELPALSYTGALAESKLELKFSELTGTGNPAGAGGVQLFQNRPNPFNGQTVIGFVLPEACEAQLRVFDVSGRLLAERKAQYPAGKNEELFEVNGTTGVLYYELTTPFGVVAKKMVAVKN